MSKGDHIEMDGIVIEACGGGKYAVQIKDGPLLKVPMCGKMKKHHIRVIPGDQVRVSLTPYDMNNGFISYRGRQ
jgi:translation initiation factor IF-1